MELRAYQKKALSMLLASWRDRPVLMMPTTSGKTCVVCELIKGAIAKGNPCVFLVHRRELVNQAVDRLAGWGVTAGAIGPGYPRTDAMILVASLETVCHRTAFPPAKVVIVDEGHHA